MSRPKTKVGRRKRDKINFKFRWRANREFHEKEIAAFTYAEACWILGQKMAVDFIDNDVPKDFELVLNDEQARVADDQQHESTLNRKDALP